MKRFAIAGIGTEVGKTVVSAIMVEALEADYWKPVQAGELDHSDTMTVEGLVANEKSRFHEEAYRLETPMSPHAAAAIDGVQVNLRKLTLPQTENNLVVELAGGLMVPVNDTQLNLDLLKMWNIPVILVASYYLGSINHTLLSIEVLKNQAVPIAGIVFNGETVPSTRQVILQQSGLPCVLELAHESELTPEIISKYARNIQI